MLYLGSLTVDVALIPQILNLGNVLQIKGSFRDGFKSDSEETPQITTPPATEQKTQSTQTSGLPLSNPFGKPSIFEDVGETPDHLTAANDDFDEFLSFPKSKTGKTYSSAAPELDFEALALEKEKEQEEALKEEQALEEEMAATYGLHALKCPDCPKSFRTKKQIREHVSNHHTYEGTLNCAFCFKEFDFPGILLRHERTHRDQHNESDDCFVACGKCDRKFANNKWVKIHREKCRGERLSDHLEFVRDRLAERTYPCQLCDQVFAKRLLLFEHRRTEHKDEKPFQCGVCGKAFAKEWAMKNHANSHLTEKNHVCAFCATAFKTESALRKHEHVHTDEHVQCGKCGKQVPKIKIRRHEKTHEEKTMRCQFCEKSFHTEHTLKVHERVHTGERPHVCTFCGKTFQQVAHKNTHELTHTGKFISS